MKTLAIIGLAFAAFTGSTSTPIPADADVETLSTKNVIEPLISVAPLSLGAGRNLTLEPGVRVTNSDGIMSFSTHGNSRMELISGSDRIQLLSPVSARITDAGLDFGTGRIYNSAAFTLRRDVQDDTDTNLKSMQESAKKLKTKNNANQEANQPAKKLKWRFLFGENPHPTAELFSQQAIQQLTHLSPVGF